MLFTPVAGWVQPRMQLVGSAVAQNVQAVTLPAGYLAGDIAVLLNCAFSSSAIPTTAVPTGFTALRNDGGTAGTNCRAIMSAKILGASETGLNGMAGSAGIEWIVMVFRPASAVAGFSFAGGHGQITENDPTQQTIAVAGITAPVLLFGQMAANGAISPRLTSPTMIEVAGSSTNHYGHYTIYNARETPVDTTYDMDDDGFNFNILQSGYLTFTLA